MGPAGEDDLVTRTTQTPLTYREDRSTSHVLCRLFSSKNLLNRYSYDEDCQGSIVAQVNLSMIVFLYLYKYLKNMTSLYHLLLIFFTSIVSFIRSLRIWKQNSHPVPNNTVPYFYKQKKLLYEDEQNREKKSMLKIRYLLTQTFHYIMQLF